MRPDQHSMFSRKKMNLDITHRCPIECLCCQRWSSFARHGIKVPGEDISLDNFKKLADHFLHLNFCGQVSDPVHHPKFIEILEHAFAMKRSVSVHHASGAKPEKWYPKAFAAHPKARWIFGIDGLPAESNMYRVNQDGEKIYRMMQVARGILISKPVWQYIVFSYNEDHIQEAVQMAKAIDVDFMTLISSRWRTPDDPLKPKNSAMRLDLYESEDVGKKNGKNEKQR